MQSQAFKVSAGPAFDLTRSQIPSLAAQHEAVEPIYDVAVEPIELARRIPGAEVVSPAAQDRVEIADQDPHILHSVPVASGSLLHALLHTLHAALRRPALEEVHASVFLLPDDPTHPLVQVAAEEVEPLPSPTQIDSPRLLRVQLQSQPREDRSYALFRLDAGRLRVAHDHEVVRVAHQQPEMGVPAFPRRIESVEVDVRQQR